MGSTSTSSSSKSPCLGWTIDDGEESNSDGNGDVVSKRSNTNAYHVIGASRSGFYLSDDNVNYNHPRRRRGTVDGSSDGDSSNGDSSTCTMKSSKLVRCTRYGHRV